MRAARVAFLGLLALAVVLVGSAPTAGPAQAQSPVVTTLAIDMDPKDGGASYTNDDHTVGTIDRCIEVSAGATVEFDVLVDAIPAGVGAGNLRGFQYFMGFDHANLTFSAQSHTTAGVNIIARHPQSCTNDPYYCFDNGDEVPEPPDSGSPASPGVHDAFIVDSTAVPLVGSGTDPYGKAGGVLGRYEITVSLDAPTGPYRIGLNDSTFYDTRLIDFDGIRIWDLPGNGVDDDSDGATDEDIMLDETVNYGLIAVGVACPLAGPDSDSDGYWDDDETEKESLSLNASSTPEHCDGVDNDLDAETDEGFPDSDGDTVKDCVDPDHPYYTDDDDDDDGFTDEDERWMTTDEQDDCPELPPDPPNPWGAAVDDAWPPDIDGNAVCDVTDALLFLAAFPSAEGTFKYSKRLDMAPKAPSDNVVDVTDALVFLAHYPSACTNP